MSDIDPAKDQVSNNIRPIFAFKGAMPTGITVSEDGRIFVNFPRWGDEVPYTVGEIRGQDVVPFPSLTINQQDLAHPGQGLISVQSVVADQRGSLWILDTAAPGLGQPIPGGAKLVQVDLKANKVVRRLVLPASVVLPTTYLNDVRFDFHDGSAGYAYITDSASRGPAALIVVDLASGEAWRRLSGHASVQPDPDFVPQLEGQALMVRLPGKTPSRFAVGADGVALSQDGATLYYSPLSSRHLFSVPTRLLRDRSLTEDEIAAAVQDLGEKGASDGIEADSFGRIYATDYEQGAIRRRDAAGHWTTLARDPRIQWPDTLALHGGWLYFTANQLHRQALFHDGKDERVKPYMLYGLQLDEPAR
ncbi:L-dopachrome tautomerase-related protein [Pseudomonas sp. PI1]|uniref:L-dopachrome tautomerase-related protein n=1 Tax=Pseudomonas sp. PI1 TaxID=1582493 RepID=UPI0015A6C3B7|nr:L-dopachrome tautomerase-related protein [Pseudomonas sp. PI1]